jgi:hypothetical protein
MPDATRIYISVESVAGHLVIDGPMILWRELLGSLPPEPTERHEDDDERAPVGAAR